MADIQRFQDLLSRGGGWPMCRKKLLLLHGFPAQAICFGSEPLLADTFNIVAPDLPGFLLVRSPATR